MDSSKYSFNNVLVYINQNNIKRRGEGEKRKEKKQTKFIVTSATERKILLIFSQKKKKSTIIDSTTGSFNVKINRLKIVKH